MRLTLFLLLFLTATAFAQLPATQRSWSDGAISGSELIAFIAENSAQPEQRKPLRFRLAGLQSPESSGALATELANTATFTFANLLSNQEIELQFIGVERVFLWNGAVNRYTLTARYIGFARVPGAYQTANGKAYQQRWTDAGAVMLRVGWAKLATNYASELQGFPDARAAYESLEAEAKTRRYGLWRWAWLFPTTPAEPNWPPIIVPIWK